MAMLTIRNIPDDVHDSLSRSAQEHGKSVEEEVIATLEKRYRDQPAQGGKQAWLDFAEGVRASLRAANNGVLPTSMVDEFLAERRKRTAEALDRLERRAASEAE